MKRIALVALILCSLVAPAAWGQGTLHLIYLRQDNSVSPEKMFDQVNQYIQQHSGDKFVVYYSDVRPVVMDQSDYNASEVRGAITSHNSTVSMSPLREINSVSEVLERYQYKKLAMACFVGPQFFENGYHNSFVARFLLVNRLNDDARTSLVYHSCGDSLSGLNMDFNERYSIVVEPTIQ